MAERFVCDPSHADFQDRIYDIYATLRDRHPVYRDETHGFYALSRFARLRLAPCGPLRSAQAQLDPVEEPLGLLHLHGDGQDADVCASGPRGHELDRVLLGGDPKR